MYDMKNYQIRAITQDLGKVTGQHIYICTAYSEDEALQCHEDFCNRNGLNYDIRYWKVVNDIAGF